MTPPLHPRTRTHLPKRTVSIIGTGSYLPEKVADQCRTGKDGRDVRRLDHQPHRHQGAPHRRRRRIHQRPRRECGTGRDRERGHQSGRNRSDHRRDHHAGHVLAEHRMLRADEDRRDQGRLLRHQRSLLRLSLRHRNRAAVHHHATPSTPSSSSARTSFRASWIGRIATPACSSATAPVRRSCAIARTATASSPHAWGATANLRRFSTSPAAAPRAPSPRTTPTRISQRIRMKGNETFKYAVNAMLDSARQVLDDAGLESRGPHVHHPASGKSAHHQRRRRAPRTSDWTASW